MEQTLDQLAEGIKQCTACQLHVGRTQAVPGEGSPKAEMLFIGEGPGQKEDETGRPFVGAAGKFLTQLIESIGLKRDDVFIANVVKCRPPNNRDPLPQEVATCTDLWLFNQIRIIKPLLIVTLGRHSMYRFLPDNLKISSVHGQPFRRNNQVFLPLYHPAAALYQGSLRVTLEHDFAKIPLLLTKLRLER